MSQNLYQYTAILSRNTVQEGKVTYTDKRSQNGQIGLPLDSECKTGEVLAQGTEQAKELATKRLKLDWPHELGWRNHENVTVVMMPETVIGAETLAIPAPGEKKIYG